MSADPSFDENRLERVRRYKNGPQLVGKLLELFLEEGPARIAAARAGEQARDFQAVVRAAHSLAPSAGNLGAVRLQQVADQIQYLKDPDWDRIGGLLRELEDAFLTVKPRLEAEKKRGEG
ncbi:MAG: Hpt domain-containing protein [Planctomycetes bacterium]|nr:Hpt domain-containing protein [Planctomycetota bacterium]